MQPKHPKDTPAERRIAREARSAHQRARALALRCDGATFAKIGGELGVSVERARRVVRKAERPHWHDKLPARALNYLINADLDALPELEAATRIARLSRRELLSARNFGRSALAAMADWLASLGLALSDSPTTKGVPHGHASCGPGADHAGSR